MYFSNELTQNKHTRPAGLKWSCDLSYPDLFSNKSDVRWSKENWSANLDPRVSRKWVHSKNSTPQVFSAGKSGVWGLSFWTVMHGASLPRRRSCAGILQQSLSTDEPQKGRNSCLRLRPRSVFCSFGVVLMCCKVNFHIVRSALQISVCLPTNPTSGAGTRHEPLGTSSSTSFPGFSPTVGRRMWIRFS